ncbi:MAG: DNA topoisomerase II, partial [Deltaproteobacteria bacterium]|nr:DNA topoisomerase II [Deltaproteobacteria bacterium]
LPTASQVYHANLRPGKTAEPSFDINADVRYARAYCNLHGLWKS